MVLTGADIFAEVLVEQGVETLHGLERDRIDLLCSLAAAFLAYCPLDIGQLEKLAPRVSEATGFEHGTGLAAVAIELAISAIGVGLQDACPGYEMGARMFAAPVARVMEQRGRWCWSAERSIVAHINP